MTKKYGSTIETIGKYTLTNGLKRVQIRNENMELIALTKTIKQARNLVNHMIMIKGALI